MPNISQWMTDTNKAGDWLNDIEGNDKRVLHATHRFIVDQPAIITITRGSTNLDPQTVRIELTRIEPDVDVGAAGREHNARAVLIGYKGHPTIADTDIRSGDLFVHNSTRYLVRFILPETVGRVEAWLEMQQ